MSASQAASKIIGAHGAGYAIIGDPRPAVTDYVHAHKIAEGTYPSLAVLVKQISDQVLQYGSLAKTPADKVQNVRNDMYLASEALRILAKDKEAELKPEEVTTLNAYKKQLDLSTKFIPTWVKIVVAVALGLGTMVGWKRIVVTVGEKIGKTHLTYGQGAAAEIVAMATIGAADGMGLPVSTTHVLSSGVAGTMLANGSGIQWSTLRNIALGWVLTLPVADPAVGHAVLPVPPPLLIGGVAGDAEDLLRRPPLNSLDVPRAPQLDARRAPDRSGGECSRRPSPAAARRSFHGHARGCAFDNRRQSGRSSGSSLRPARDSLDIRDPRPFSRLRPRCRLARARAARARIRRLARGHARPADGRGIGQGEDPRRAACAVLRPLRRAARRSAGIVDDAALRAATWRTGRTGSESSRAAPATTKAS